MLKDANFLCEIGTEEVPAGYMPPAIEATAAIFRKTLDENRVDHGEIDVCATPRRIAVAISSVRSPRHSARRRPSSRGPRSRPRTTPKESRPGRCRGFSQATA